MHHHASCSREHLCCVFFVRLPPSKFLDTGGRSSSRFLLPFKEIVSFCPALSSPSTLSLPLPLHCGFHVGFLSFRFSFSCCDAVVHLHVAVCDMRLSTRASVCEQSIPFDNNPQLAASLFLTHSWTDPSLHTSSRAPHATHSAVTALLGSSALISLLVSGLSGPLLSFCCPLLS